MQGEPFFESSLNALVRVSVMLVPIAAFKEKSSQLLFQFGHQVPIEQRSLVGVINVTPVLTGDTRRGRSVYFLLILIIHIIDISTAL